MKFVLFLVRCLFILTVFLLSFFIMFYIFKPIFFAESLIFPYSVYPFDVCIKIPATWKYIKLIYIFCYSFSTIIILNSISLFVFKDIIHCKKRIKNKGKKSNKSLSLFIGNSFESLAPIILS